MTCQVNKILRHGIKQNQGYYLLRIFERFSALQNERNFATNNSNKVQIALNNLFEKLNRFIIARSYLKLKKAVMLQLICVSTSLYDMSQEWISDKRTYGNLHGILEILYSLPGVYSFFPRNRSPRERHSRSGRECEEVTCSVHFLFNLL